MQRTRIDIYMKYKDLLGSVLGHDLASFFIITCWEGFVCYSRIIHIYIYTSLAYSCHFLRTTPAQGGGGASEQQRQRSGGREREGLGLKSKERG